MAPAPPRLRVLAVTSYRWRYSVPGTRRQMGSTDRYTSGLGGMVWHGRTLHGMVWTVKLITVWFEAAPPPAGHTSPPARTNHLTVKQRCRCTPAKNQPQTNDFRLRAGLHEMHLVFWRAPWSSKVLHCSSRFQCSWWLMMVGGFRLFIWSK